MSSYAGFGGGPPQSISVGGQGGGPVSGGPMGGGGNETEAVSLVKQAQVLLRRALEDEPDEEDKLLLEELTSSCQKYLASQQKMGDQAIGAGPGAKLVRKVTGRAQRQSGY